MSLLCWLLFACQPEVAPQRDCDPADEQPWYVDLDGDGHGAGDPRTGCTPFTGFSLVDGDCDDGDPLIHPDAEEDECSEVDRDCDGAPGLRDEDGDGYSTCAADCDDANPAVFPGAEELCNGIDDDCDGDTDGDATDAGTWYADNDGDGWGDADQSVQGCTMPADHVADPGDCDDEDPDIVACGSSCLEVLELGMGTTDGIYELDPCGTGDRAEYWCDLTTLGGGWTVAGWQPANATDSLGLEARNRPGDADFSVPLNCVPFSEIRVFNLLDGEGFSRTYDPQIWEATALNLAVGDAGDAFKLGTYASSANGTLMGCVGYSYQGEVHPEYACDSDGYGGAQGHLADYAGEYCAGGRLDGSWAWTDGVSCVYRGVDYDWGFAIR